MIYFIGNIEQNIVKIGYTTDFKQRFNSLKTACPYKIVVFKTTNGTIEDEKSIHILFNEYRLNGEWFTLNDKIIEYYTSLVDYDKNIDDSINKKIKFYV